MQETQSNSKNKKGNKSKCKNLMPVHRLPLENDNFVETCSNRVVAVNSGVWTMMPNCAGKGKTRSHTRTLNSQNSMLNSQGKALNSHDNRLNSHDNVSTSGNAATHNSVISSNRNRMEDGEIMEVSAKECGEFEEMDEAAQIELEIAEMEKQLAKKKLDELKKRREDLQRDLTNVINQ